MNKTYDFVRIGEYFTLLWACSWLEIESYLISDFEDQEYNPEILFKTLLGHKLYQRSYQCPKALDRSSDIHGPFVIAKLSPDNFIKITAEQFTKRIDDIFYSEYGFSQDDGAIDIARQAEARWLLNKFPKEFADFYELGILSENEKYHHEFWGIYTFFYEFIIIDRSAKKIHVCVISED